MSQEEQEIIMKIARHFSGLYKERTQAIIHLAEAISNMKIKISRDHLKDTQWMV